MHLLPLRCWLTLVKPAHWAYLLARCSPFGKVFGVSGGHGHITRGPPSAWLNGPRALRRLYGSALAADPQLADAEHCRSGTRLLGCRRAFQNFSQRVPLKTANAVATTLIQTEKYGTPLASALRVLSAEFRHERMMEAEARAARLPVLMTIPMMFFLVPPIFVILVAPAACSMIRTLH
jgi:hypothetical protein